MRDHQKYISKFAEESGTFRAEKDRTHNFDILILIFLIIIGSTVTSAFAAPGYQESSSTPTPTLEITYTIVTAESGEGNPLCQEYHIVEPNDIISKIAQQYYGDASIFAIIIETTNKVAEDDPAYDPIEKVNSLKVGQRLCIPNTKEYPIISREIVVDSPAIVPTAVITPDVLILADKITEFPADKAILFFENFSPAEIIFDLIGPNSLTQQIPVGETYTFIIDAGSYKFNAHAPNATVTLAPGLFEVSSNQVVHLVTFERSYDLMVYNSSDIKMAAKVSESQSASTIPVVATVKIISTISAPIPTLVFIPISTSIPTLTPTQILTPTVTPTKRPSSTPTSTLTPTQTLTPTVTPTKRPSSTPTLTPTQTLTPTVTPTKQPSSTPTSTLTPTQTLTPTVTPTKQPSSTPTSASTPTATSTPTRRSSPTSSPTDGKAALAPPTGLARVYMQNFFSDEAQFDINGQTITVGANTLELLDLKPSGYNFTVTIPRGTDSGYLELEPDESWLIRVDAKGSFGWTQVYP
jgi:hypothetical protein